MLDYKNETDHQGVFLGYGPNDCHDYPLTTLGSKESPPNGARDRFQNLVDAAGLEPAMPFGRKIYSLLGLPIFLHIQNTSYGTPDTGSFKNTQNICDSPTKIG